MKKKKKNKEEIIENKKQHKFLNLFTGFVTGMFICITAYLIYNIAKLSGIEDLIRYIVMALLIVLCIFVLIKYIKFKKKNKISKYIIFILIIALIGTGEFYASNLISKSVSFIDKLNKDEVTYKSSLIVMKDGNYTTLKKVKNAKIGIISDKDDTEGYVLAQNIIKKDKIDDDNLVEYDDYLSMLNDLYDNEVGGIFITGNYADSYSSIDKYANIKDDVIELDSYSKRMKKKSDKNTEVSTKKVTEPFTMLLLGVDSETEDISKASGLGDSIMLITFNPKTLTATMFSIPRDTYVSISCYRNVKSKITHAAAGGDSCMINTVENFTGIDIDYYAKVNFKGLVNIVDALGGIDVEVPYSFCEQNSNRSFSSNDMIYVKKGLQTLNGEQALALSRNRKTVSGCGKEWNQGTRNDFVRGQNQQLVIKGIVNKLKNIKSINQLYEVLDAVSLSLDTNLTREQILGFYNVFKKVLLNSDSLSDTNDIIKIQKTYLNGSGGYIYDYVGGMKLYEFVPSTQSLNAIIKAMKVNLELAKEEYETSFSFSIDEPYEEKVIGSDLYGGVATYDDPTEKSNSCGTNEELGADGVSCVCKNGYERKDGTCTKKKVVCDDDEELDSDGTTCIKKSETSDNSSSKKVSKCVLENGYYYWYDSDGNKNTTKYIESTCTKTESTSPTDDGTKKEDSNPGGNQDDQTGDAGDSSGTVTDNKQESN